MDYPRGLGEVIDKFDIFIIDQWGVLHDGKKAYEGAISCLEELRLAGKKVILLSNTSKRKDNVFHVLDKLGFHSQLFDDCVTSGEIGWEMLTKSDVDPFFVKGRDNIFLFGNGDDDEPYIASSGRVITSIENSNLAIARGTFKILDGLNNVQFESPDKLMENIDPWLERCLNRKLPLLVTNPDVNRPGSGSPMPGRIGERYSDMGGDVLYIGKPHQGIYEECFTIVERLTGCPIDKSRICGIGDSLLHDILGANRNGITSIWTANGVHASEMNGAVEGAKHLADKETLDNLFIKYNIFPDYTLPCFLW